MSFDWQKYLNLAKELSGHPVKGTESEEAKLRSAISRAYYAAFHVAKDYAFTSSKPPDAGAENMHGEIRQWFKSNPHKVATRIKTDLDRLRRDRNRADYDGDMGSLNAMRDATSEAIRMSERIITNVGTLSGKK